MVQHNSVGAWSENDEDDETAYSLNSILFLGEAPKLQTILDEFRARKRAWPRVKASIMADRDRREQAIGDGTWEPPAAPKPKPKVFMPMFWKKQRVATVKSPYIGVNLRSDGRYLATLVIQYQPRKQRSLGLFDDPLDAAIAFDDAHFALWADPNKLNFPERFQAKQELAG